MLTDKNYIKEITKFGNQIIITLEDCYDAEMFSEIEFSLSLDLETTPPREYMHMPEEVATLLQLKDLHDLWIKKLGAGEYTVLPDGNGIPQEGFYKNHALGFPALQHAWLFYKTFEVKFKKTRGLWRM